MSVRAILVDFGKVWYAANNGKYGFYDLNNKKMFNGHIASEILKLEFRSIAKRGDFIPNVGAPLDYIRCQMMANRLNLVYRENDPKAFYDSMQFFNDEVLRWAIRLITVYP